MLTEVAELQYLTELAGAIRQRIEKRLGGHAQALQVEVGEHQVLIRGATSCYYHKQLALQEAQSATGNSDKYRIELEIEVHTAASKSDSGRKLPGRLRRRA